MNIFVSDKDPKISAINLDDKRVVKMILETAQLLSTAIIMNGGEAPYKATHKKHPATIWAANTKSNFMWLVQHGLYLGEEYSHRFNKEHKSIQVINHIIDNRLFEVIPNGELESFANCTANQTKGISYKHLDDAVEAYRAYLSSRWDTDTLVPKWTNRSKPEWYRGLYA